jgi:sterol desaturase/sphingolipid hydroxylase (fatty acid hydroxylase superfamily)
MRGSVVVFAIPGCSRFLASALQEEIAVHEGRQRMSHLEISHSKEPIRLFKSDFLEFFTHIHPAVVLAIWLPVAAAFLAVAIVGRRAGLSPLYIPAGFLVGLFVWTLAEYTLHRFVFHFPPRTPWQERLSFLIHGVHHAQPMSKTRLVMPPPVSIPLALLFYGFFYLVLGVLLGVRHWVAPLFSGFITGYLIYDMLHYSTHHFRLSFRVWQFLRQHHMRHHSQTPNMRFGVSSPLWDIVFGTMPPS